MSAPARPEVLLVLGAPWLGAARLPRVLREAGCRVTLFCDPRFPAAKTRYVDALVPAPRDPPTFLTRLRETLAALNPAWTLLGDDTVLGALLEAPWAEPLLPVDRAASRCLVSKAAFVHALPADLPPSEIVRGTAEAREAAARIGFPVICKPDFGSGGVGVFRADVPGAVELPRDGTWVVQRFIDGAVGSTVALFHRGRLLRWMTSFKDRIWPEPFGPSCARRYAHLPGHEEVLARAGDRLGIHGLCCFDWIVPRVGGGPLLLEFNARPAPWTHHCLHYGVDVAGGIRELIAGGGSARPPPTSVPEPFLRMFPQDLVRAAAEHDWGLMWRWARGRAGPTDTPHDDPRLRRELRRRVWKALRHA